MLKDDTPGGYAQKLVEEDIEHYKQTLDRNRTQYRIVDKAEQPDGSVIIKVIKQYNNSPIGDYLN